MDLPFPSIGQVETLRDLFTDLATAIYILPERKEKSLNTLHKYPKYANFNIKYWTVDTLPATFKGLIPLYFKQPITEKDQTEFLDTYMIPFMGTGKPLIDLYNINPVVFRPVLDALIRSKRIQRIISQPKTLHIINDELEFRKGALRESALEDFQAEAKLLTKTLINAYNDQEVVIANEFLKAQELEPRFLASEEAMRAKIAANAGRKKRKTRRGGKRSSQKSRALRRRR